jgi:peroxiredoxin
MKTVNECRGIAVGDLAPDFEAKDQNGNIVMLSELLKQGPVVLVFYRGQWCPVCIPHLRKLQDGLSKVSEKGASIIAVTPEKQELIQKTFVKTKVAFPILFDKDYKIMKQYDVAFVPSRFLRWMYNWLLRANLKKVHSDESETLPIPATFIIGKDGKVKYRHFDPDYSKRLGVDEILQTL